MLDVESFGPSRPPRTPGELRAWLRAALGVEPASGGLEGTARGPWEYLVHSYFADGLAGEAREASGPLDSVVWANRGGGKTFLGALATLLDVVFKPGIEVRILAGSVDQGRRMFAHLRRFVDPDKHPIAAALAAGKMTERRFSLSNGSEVEVLAQSHTSVRGTRVQKLRCDEADLFNPEVWEAAQLTTRSARCGEFLVRGVVECLSTMHVPHGVMHGLVEEAREGKRALFRWGAMDVLEACLPGRACQDGARGPCVLWEECRGRAKERRAEAIGHLGIDDAIAMKKRVSRAAWEAEMLCLRPRRDHAVVPEFDPARHVFDDDALLRRPGVRWVGGMDFGIRAPTVVLWGAASEEALWIVDERSVADVPLRTHVEAILEGLARPGVEAWPALSWIGIDPAGASRNGQSGESDAAVLRRAGLRVRARKFRTDKGLEWMRARLAPASGPPRLFVHRRCKVLIESLVRYHYPPGDPETNQPVRTEGHDHAVDALRYLVQNLDAPSESATFNYTQSRRVRGGR